MSDRAYLHDVQYRDETNLNARSALHERFSVTNRRRAIAEFEEVLKPDGVLYAVTIGHVNRTPGGPGCASA